ncbi:hypothetical protein DPMN_138305 [Dreissena polymorpha]|uniref:Uncharacterized protein n=1 Tax=Dreissena polymorpha TaxID=45954 RepID=A0A9D4G718_DREPO|nr:hypothetical protein DPMN_138305 [Dreissena polymorpha]
MNKTPTSPPRSTPRRIRTLPTRRDTSSRRRNIRNTSSSRRNIRRHILHPLTTMGNRPRVKTFRRQSRRRCDNRWDCEIPLKTPA